MSSLLFKKVTKEIVCRPFDCGVASINKYVRDSYFPTIAQDAYAYSIEAQGKILGFFQIMFREMELDYFPEEISDYDPGIKDGRISTAHIRFIAIDKMYHKNKIGTKTLEAIIKNVEEFSESWPIRVITIDGRTDLVNWYKSKGFKHMTRNIPGQEGTTDAMFLDCMHFSKELEEYCEEQ